VRYGDGRALLTDFGACHYPGAAALTPPGTDPGTPLYRAPESWSRVLNLEPSEHSRAQTADDLFALGFTACRLVTGEYPELSTPRRDECGLWRVDSVVPPEALRRDERLSPRLRAAVLRMLSMRSEERGTAEQLAEALEQDAAQTLEDSPAPRSVRPRSATRSPEAPPPAAPVPVASTRSARPWLALAAAVLVAAGGAWWVETRRSTDTSVLMEASAKAASRSSVGTSGLGDAATAPSAAAGLQEPKGIAEDSLPTPLPDQVRPDSQGHCPHKKQVALNGGCWFELPLNREDCEAGLSGYMGIMFKNKCYLPHRKWTARYSPTLSGSSGGGPAQSGEGLPREVLIIQLVAVEIRTHPSSSLEDARSPTELPLVPVPAQRPPRVAVLP
jgi:eukaryotic-like serine/threonine-protein kinase